MKLKKIKPVISMYFFALSIFNFILGNAPFFALRKKLLQLIGWKIGRHVAIHRKIKIYSLSKPSVIRDNVVINKGCILDNRRGIYIGSNVSISQSAVIFTLGHDVNNPYFVTKGAQTIVENDVVIFTGAVIMPGIIIKKGAVILPYSIVTKNVDEFTIVGGNPAKLIGKRNNIISYKHDYRVWFGI